MPKSFGQGEDHSLRFKTGNVFIHFFFCRAVRVLLGRESTLTLIVCLSVRLTVVLNVVFQLLPLMFV